jgi:hypothetical protein
MITKTQIQTAIVIDSLGADILEEAFQAADAVATSAGRTRGGWVGLCKVQGSGSDPYKVAIRRVSSERQFQFGCACKHWIFRCNKDGSLCKHQQDFLANAVQHPERFWMYKAGLAFAQAVASALAPSVQTAIHGHKANEVAA